MFIKFSEFSLSSGHMVADPYDLTSDPRSASQRVRKGVSADRNTRSPNTLLLHSGFSENGVAELMKKRSFSIF